ncbi:UNVERIFIED_CONTAM: hypothetical protein HDU68_005428, partial [Siphonaria sp. JEL0065]
TLPGSDGQRYRVISYYLPQDVNPLNFSRAQHQLGAVSLQCPSQLPEFKKFVPFLKSTDHLANLLARAFKDVSLLRVSMSPQSNGTVYPTGLHSDSRFQPQQQYYSSPTPSLQHNFSSYHNDTPHFHGNSLQRCSCGGLGNKSFAELMNHHAYSNWSKPAILAPIRLAE